MSKQITNKEIMLITEALEIGLEYAKEAQKDTYKSNKGFPDRQKKEDPYVDKIAKALDILLNMRKNQN